MKIEKKGKNTNIFHRRRLARVKRKQCVNNKQPITNVTTTNGLLQGNVTIERDEEEGENIKRSAKNINKSHTRKTTNKQKANTQNKTKNAMCFR